MQETHEVIKEQTNEPDQLQALREIDTKLRELENGPPFGSMALGEYESRIGTLKKRKREAEAKLNELLTKDPEFAKKLRFALYGNRTVQFLLSGFLGDIVTSLVPDFNTDRSVRYSILENIDPAGIEMSNPAGLLDELAYVGILEKRLYERFVRCPKCGSHSNVFLRLKCPQCGSLDVASGKLTEHLVCGTVHEFEEFVFGNELKCPSCSEKLVEERKDYHIVGTFNTCVSCKVHFDDPKQAFICRKCEEEFDLKKSAFFDTYTYTLHKELISEVKGVVGLPVFKSALEALGFRVELPGTVTGSSGIIHNFALCATSEGKTLVLDVVESDKEIEEKEIFAFYAKLLDVKPSKGVLIAMPSLSQRAKDFAASILSTGIVFFAEGKNTLEALEQLKVTLSKIDSWENKV